MMSPVCTFRPPRLLADPRSVPEYRRSADLLNRWRPALPHGEREFSAEDVEDLLHAFLPECGQAVDVGPADAHGARADCQGLIDIGATAESAVDENGDLRANGVDNLRKDIDGTAASFGG